MFTRNLLLACLIIFCLSSAFAGFDKPTATKQINGVTIMEYPQENVTVAEYQGQKIVFNKFKAEPSNLIDYASKMQRRILSKYASIKQTTNAVIAFKDLLTESALQTLINKYGLVVSSVRYESSEGGGRLGWPLDYGLINKWQEQYKANLADPNFVLLKGISAANANLDYSSLLNLAKDPNILLVDIGPVDFLEEYPNAIIVPGTENIPYYYDEMISDLPANDNIVPVIEIKSPVNAAEYPKGEQISIDYSVKDDRDLYVETKAFINGNELAEPKINTTVLNLGNHVISLLAEDDAGNKTSVSSLFYLYLKVGLSVNTESSCYKASINIPNGFSANDVNISAITLNGIKPDFGKCYMVMKEPFVQGNKIVLKFDKTKVSQAAYNKCKNTAGNLLKTACLLNLKDKYVFDVEGRISGEKFKGTQSVLKKKVIVVKPK